MAGLSAVRRFAKDAAGDAAGAVRADGAAVLEQVWQSSAIDRVRETVLRQHPELTDQSRLHDYYGHKGKRFIAPVLVSRQLAETGLFETPVLDALCGTLLGADFVYEAFGIMVVHPGIKSQKIHRDGGILFAETGVDKILPPSALTLAIPLVDVDADCAPTGVDPGTHRTPYSDERPLVPIELQRGDLALWDFRVAHAGLENRTDRWRPVLYFTACRPFWIDHKNFGDTARVRLTGDPAVIAELGARFVRAEPGAG